MSTEPNGPGTGPKEGLATEQPSSTPEPGEVERRSDLEEDRRRQQDLDYSELGGEA